MSGLDGMEASEVPSQDAGGISSDAQGEVGQNEDAPISGPSIASFTASPSIISAGQSSTLSWDVSQATMLALDQGAGSALISVLGTVSLIVTPTKTTTYTLTLNGTKSAQVTVTVVPVPTITSFFADPVVVPDGEKTTLTAVFSGGTATLDQGIGAMVSGVGKPTGPISGSTVFTLTVENGLGGVTKATTAATVTSVCPCEPSACFQGSLVVLTPTLSSVHLSDIPIVAPVSGAHVYTSKLDLELSSFSSGGTVKVNGTLGAQGCAGSFDLVGTCTKFMTDAGRQISLATAYDYPAGKSFELSYKFTAANRLLHLGLEGNWYSPVGQKNTVDLTIAVTPTMP